MNEWEWIQARNDTHLYYVSDSSKWRLILSKRATYFVYSIRSGEWVDLCTESLEEAKAKALLFL